MNTSIRFAAAAMAILAAGCTPQPQTPAPSASAPTPVSSPQNGAVLRFDGVYQSPQQRQADVWYWDYLRFYPDGVAIIGASTGSPQEIKAWFERDRPMSGTGRPLPAVRYALANGRVSFSFILEGRRVDFAATIGVDSLRVENFRPAPGQPNDPVLVFKPW